MKRESKNSRVSSNDNQIHEFLSPDNSFHQSQGSKGLQQSRGHGSNAGSSLSFENELCEDCKNHTVIMNLKSSVTQLKFENKELKSEINQLKKKIASDKNIMQQFTTNFKIPIKF